MLEKLWKTSIFRRIPGCKASLHFNKMPKSLRQVLQTYSETCILCMIQKIVLQKQSANIDLKVSGKFCDEI